MDFYALFSRITFLEHLIKEVKMMKTNCSNKNSKVRYIIFEEKYYSEEVGEYIGYGIKCSDACGREIERIEDISLDYDFVKDLADNFNTHSLSPIHFIDAVIDAIE